MSQRVSVSDVNLEVKENVGFYFEEIRRTANSAENLTLRETVDHVKSHVPDALRGMDRTTLDNKVEAIYKIASEVHGRLQEQVLSVEDIAVLRMFTAEFRREPHFYTLVNYHLKDRRALPAMVPFIWKLMNVLKKCPVFGGTHVYRGIHLEGEALEELLSMYTVGPRHQWHCFSSASAWISVPQGFLGETVVHDARGREYRFKKGVLFMIHLRPGARAIKRFSEFYGEEEVLLPPNFTFEVIDITSPNEGFHILQLKELESVDPILSLDTSEEAVINIAIRQPADSTEAEQSTAMNATDGEPYVPPELTGSADSTRAISDRLEAIQRSIQEKATDSDTPLLEAASTGDLEVVTYLLKLGADIHHKKNDWNTPLHLAAKEGRLDVVTYLLQQPGADINCRNEWDNTPLHSAAFMGRLEVVTYLLQQPGADINCRDRSKHTPLHLAAFMGRLEVVTYLLQQPGADINCRNLRKHTPLHSAALQGRLAVVIYLLQQPGADINCRDLDGDTPLHGAAWEGRLDVVTYLLQQPGADINCRDYGGNTPLHLAASRGHLEVVTYLLQQPGADNNCSNNDGDTPLHRAAFNGHLKVITCLLQQGADKTIKNKCGRIPFDVISSGCSEHVMAELKDLLKCKKYFFF